MSLLLLFASPPEGPPKVTFSVSGSLTVASPKLEARVSLSLSAEATFSPVDTRATFAELELPASGTFAGVAAKAVVWPELRLDARGALVATVRPRGKQRRTVVVDAEGNPYGELENARHGAITWELNAWEEASFALGLADPKSHLVLEERIREVQLWRGDQLLVFGPMVRPAADLRDLGVTVKGPAWHLSRRHIGRANRGNRLTNGSFEDGLSGWSFLKTKHFLDFAPLHPSAVTVHAPGKTGRRAVAIRMEHAPWYTPPARVNAPNTNYTVVPGDTLWRIASTFYGSGIEWPRIYNANAAQIEAAARAAGLWNPRDPGHWIFPGQVLTIPGVPSSQQVDPPPDANSRWGQVFGYQEVTVSGGVRGVVATLTGWAYVRSDWFSDYGLAEWGLVLARMPNNYRTSNFWTANFGSAGNTWGGARAFYTDTLEFQTSKIDEEHPFDQWIRHEVTITIPPGRTEKLIARIEAVSGMTLWDDLRLTFDDAFEAFDTDQAEIVDDLVAHAQDSDFDKTDVNLEVDAPATGIRRDLVALHSEHANVWGLVSGFTEQADGIDLSTMVTPTSRKLVVHYPAKGSFRPDLALELGRNVAAFAWAFDGETASSSVIVLGTGNGSDREEASAINLDAFAGNLTLEEVFSVAEGTPIELLDEVAEERLAVVSSPEVLTITTYPHDDDVRERNLLGRLTVGDTVPVRIRRGGLSISDTYRAVRITLNPDDSLGIVLNRREPVE